MGRATVVVALTCLGLLVAESRAVPQEAPAATHLYSSPDGLVTLGLPFDWKVTRERKGEKSVLDIVAVAPGATRPVEIEVYHLPGMRTERGQAYYERETQPRQYEVDTRGEVRLDPLPHLIMDIPHQGTLFRHVWMYRIVNRNGITVHTMCSPDDWPAVKDAVARVAMGLVADYEEWPARPPGYREVVRDGYVYLLHPAVKDKDMEAVHRRVMEQEAAYAKVHGPVPKPEWNRPIVVVHAAKADAAQLCPAAARDEYGSAAQPRDARLFTVPPQNASAGFDADFGSALATLLHYQTYGGCFLKWLCAMDQRVPWQEGIAGRPLPAIAESQARSIPLRLDRFDRLAGEESFDEAQRHQLFAYAALFRCGGKPWKDAFAAFMSDAAATGDLEAAQAKHLLSLDQAKLQAAAEAFVAKGFTVVKGR